MASSSPEKYEVVTDPQSFNRCKILRKSFCSSQDKKQILGLALDQAHVQNNALVKSDGGAVCLTENRGALRRWMVAGPEMSR